MAWLTALIVTGVALGIAGAVTGGISGAVQAKQQAEIAEFNEKLALRNAEQANANAAAAENNAARAAEAQMAETRRAEQIAREKARQKKALNSAWGGMSGTEFTSGSSLLVAIDDAVTDELNALEIRRQGKDQADQIIYSGKLNAFDQRLQAKSFQGEATNYKMQSKAYKDAAPYQTTGTILSGVGSSLSALSTLKGK